jgi:hypothetical protein
LKISTLQIGDYFIKKHTLKKGNLHPDEVPLYCYIGKNIAICVSNEYGRYLLEPSTSVIKPTSVFFGLGEIEVYKLKAGERVGYNGNEYIIITNDSTRTLLKNICDHSILFLDGNVKVVDSKVMVLKAIFNKMGTITYSI